MDGPSLGIPRQNGNTYFLQRFALRPHGGYDPTAAMKFALEHQNPFVTGAVISQTGGVYPATNYSLLTVSNANVLLWALKLHDDGPEHGLVARLWNLSDASTTAEITFAPGLTAAHRTTHIETDLEVVPLTGTGALPLPGGESRQKRRTPMPRASTAKLKTGANNPASRPCGKTA